MPAHWHPRLLLWILIAFCLLGPTHREAAAQIAAVEPTVETVPSPSLGDTADDPSIWIHPGNPSQSVVFGTDKDSGIGVYDLAGNEIQFLPDGEMNNGDVRYGLPLGGGTSDILALSNRTDKTISIYTIDPASGLLTHATAPGAFDLTETDFSPYGLCMYRSSASGNFFVFVNDKDGRVEQWQIFDDGSGLVTGTRVRSFSVSTQPEGCVADDELALFYLGEEEFGLWRFGAEPGDGSTGTLIDLTGPGGHLAADVEGLTIYYGSGGSGYLIASSQGSDDYVIYRREGNNDYVGTFEIVEGNGIDKVSNTDGIDVSNVSLGPAFPSGLFAAHDGSNAGQNSNYKFVPWQDIAAAFSPPLEVNTGYDPRQGQTNCSDGIDNDNDGFTDFPDDPQCASPAGKQEAAHHPGCGLGGESILLVTLCAWLRRRSQRRTEKA